MADLNSVLITGANGNLGRLVATRLEARGIGVIAFDLPGTEGPHTAERMVSISGDIRDTALLREAMQTHRPDAVMHLASLLSGSSEADTALAWQVNATASVGLLNLAQDLCEGPFVFASTIATYGPDLADPLPLDAPQWPENIYGVTKVAVERMGAYLRHRSGLDFRCLRFPMVLSPFAPASALTAYPSHAFRAAADGTRFSFPVAPQTGMSNLFLTDVVSSLVGILLAKRTRLTQPAYNLHGFHVTAREVLAMIQRTFPDFEADFMPDPVVDRLIRGWPDRMDSSAARQDWGWQPEHDFDAAAKALVAMIAQKPDAE